MVNSANKVPCYTTGTGIRIGCMYTRPLPELNHDEEIIQMVLLGIDPTNRRFKFWFTTYCMGLAFCFMLLSTFRGKFTMMDVFALVAVLFVGLGLGGIALAVFFYAVERLQAYGRERDD